MILNIEEIQVEHNKKFHYVDTLMCMRDFSEMIQFEPVFERFVSTKFFPFPRFINDPTLPPSK